MARGLLMETCYEKIQQKTSELWLFVKNSYLLVFPIV